jgi:transcriptional regulator with XRE-family HTH domain
MYEVTTTPTDGGWVPTFTLGDRMAKARHEAHIEAQQMAQRLGSTPTTISRWERGHNPPSWPAVVLWAQVTGVSLEWLRGDDFDENGRARKSGCVAVELPFGDPDPYRSTLVLAA